MTILDRIIETKQAEIAAAQQRTSIDVLRESVKPMGRPRDFLGSLTALPGTIRLIAEIKKASPSAGTIVADFDPVRIARIYAEHGAAALSVLTDESYFQGRLDFIGQVKRDVRLPVLRKDFLIDPYQVYEARAAGADAILLIAEVLEPSTLVNLAAVAAGLGLGILVEVHSEPTLTTVLEILGPPETNRYLLGINNRDLAAQRTDLSIMTRLARHLPPGTSFVAESGIATREDVLAAQHAGACAILVGESLLRANDIGKQIDRLMGRSIDRSSPSKNNGG